MSKASASGVTGNAGATGGSVAAPASKPPQSQVPPAVGVTALANTPVDPNAQAVPAAAPSQSEVERIADLYARSLELYSQGELVAARQGFAEVAKSGLFRAPEGKRPEDFIATIDRLQAAQSPAQPAPRACGDDSRPRAWDR